jgi:phenylalanyl-tRNA synthetase alpha chain
MNQTTIQNLQSQISQLQFKLQGLNHAKINRTAYLGKKGYINNLTKLIPQFPSEDRQTAGQLINKLKQTAKKHFSRQPTTKNRQPQTATLDPTYSPYSTPLGFLHPVSQMTRTMNEFFRQYGFSVMDGPEIETDEFNFKRTNLPPDHPARDLQDTLYIEEPNILLRTHTSSVETRTLADYQPPLRIVIPGKVYRHETTNASNNVMFFQYQGVAVDKNLTMANLKWLLHEFIKHFYGPDQETRFRCKYYPEVEPTAGLDLACNFCDKKGCTVCKGRGWIEALGCGMIHPNILKMANINPNEWTGFAWGMGLDRLVMTKYSIPDVRMLTDGSITYPYL